jgi:uncharacterized protein YbjT (DUF2867 family)
VPVLVTGGETGLGREAVRALARAGGEVRVWLDEYAPDEDREALRRAGFKTAVGAIDDEGRLERALERVHTVVHCWGGPLTPPDEELDGLAGVLSAALGAGCRRLVWPSHLGAGAPDGDPYLEACAEAEALLDAAGIETIVFRRALTYGPDDELTSRLAGPGGDDLPPDARHAPLLSADLAAALAQADASARTSARSDLSLVLELAGPQEVTAATLVAGLRKVLDGHGTGALPPATAALYALDRLPGPAALGKEGTTFDQGLERLAR